MQSLNPNVVINKDVLTKGSRLCTDDENTDIITAVLRYMKDTLKLCTHDQDLRIRKFCIREQKYFLLCVHMAFKD